MINLRLLNALLQRGLIVDEDDALQGLLQQNHRPKPVKEFKSQMKFQGNLYRNVILNKKKILNEDLLHFKLTTSDPDECRKIAENHDPRFETNDTYLTQTLLPNKIIRRFPVADSSIYVGKYTSSGDMYVAMSQQDITIYDSRDPENPRKIKKIRGQNVNWTIADVDIDNNEELMIYSCLSTRVNILDLNAGAHRHEPLNFNTGAVDDDLYWGGDSVRILNAKFSGDGTEIVGGSFRGKVVVYHIPTRQVLNTIQGHSNDTNSVCFADRQNSNLLFTGGDDCYIKAWDRRILGQGQDQPVGVFIGHEEGIASISSRNDGFYVASNGKDQQMKLWDIRRIAPAGFIHEPLRRLQGFDYRWEGEYRSHKTKHPNDSSVYSFKGHKVLRTQIRCAFSPLHTTNSRYLYTGSSDGIVHIYDILTCETVAKLKPSTHAQHQFHPYLGQNDVVRDVSWHPYKPYLSCTSFHGKVTIFKFQSNGEGEFKELKEKGTNNEGNEGPTFSQSVEGNEAEEVEDGEEVVEEVEYEIDYFEGEDEDQI